MNHCEKTSECYIQAYGQLYVLADFEYLMSYRTILLNLIVQLPNDFFATYKTM